MSYKIENQASLSFLSGGIENSSTSNVAMTTLIVPLSLAKTSVEVSYTKNQTITYILTITNTASTSINSVIIRDNMGTIESLNLPSTTYVGPSYLYINGLFSSSLSPVLIDGEIEYTISAIEPLSTATVIFQAKVNEYAPLSQDSSITNTLTVSADTFNQDVTTEYTIPINNEARVSIVKSMSPNPVYEGGELSYEFQVSNCGNIEATSLVLSDSFSPAPSSIVSLYLDEEIVEVSEYDYVDGTLTFPSAGSTLTLTIPPATFERNDNNEVVITPSIIDIKVVGVI